MFYLALKAPGYLSNAPPGLGCVELTAAFKTLRQPKSEFCQEQIPHRQRTPVRNDKSNNDKI
jgi:hypothetical protein